MVLASLLAPIVGLAAGLVVIATALGYLIHSGRIALGWLRPRPPLVALGHPHENVMPSAWGLGGGDAHWQQQVERHEHARLSGLTVSYLIENKGTSAVRELSTGMRTFDGMRTYTHEPCFVQILGPGEKVEIKDLEPPREWWDGMTDKDRAVRFLYWGVFTVEGGRTWEATYDPQARQMTYRVLRRRAP